MLEMARGALFNSLGERVRGAAALELYAGSGALGLEALSRGAEKCLFVERDKAAAAALTHNIARCRMQDRAETRMAAAEAFLAGASGDYSLAFVDPPFAEGGEWRIGGGAETAMRSLAGIMAVGGSLVLRLDDSEVPPEWPNLESEDERRYGRSLICRYRRR
jgi:16S rRNA (guanine966-N2)-methyltransferase